MNDREIRSAERDLEQGASPRQGEAARKLNQGVEIQEARAGRALTENSVNTAARHRSPVTPPSLQQQVPSPPDFLKAEPSSQVAP